MKEVRKEKYIIKVVVSFLFVIINYQLSIINYCYSQSVNQKQKINAKVKENDEEDARFKIENYYNELNNFSDDNIYKTSNSRNNRADIIIYNFFLNENVSVKNDLDLTNSTENSYKIREYLKNIKVFLNDSAIHFEPDIKYVKTFFHDAAKNNSDSSYIFIKAEVVRKLTRIPGHGANSIEQNFDLDFLFYKKPDDIMYIYSITKHQNDTNKLKKVIIDQNMPTYATGKIYIKSETPNVQVSLNNFYDYSLQDSGVLPYYKTGTYKMKISKEKYYDIDTIIKIKPNQTDTFHIGHLIPKLGHIVFNVSPPEAEIFINNEKITYVNNRTTNNEQQTTVYQGNLKIDIKADHYNTVSLDKILNEQEIKINASLKPRLGHLSLLNGNEFTSNATVFIDQHKVGQIPVKNIEIIEGNNKIKIEKDNCLIERNIVISENQDTTMVIRLVKDRALTLITDPSGADIFVDGVNSGKSNFKKNIDVGIHKIKISKKNYSDVNDTINVKCDSEDTIERWYNLKLNLFSYIINSEVQGSDVYIKQLHPFRGNSYVVCKTPDTIGLSFGKYKIKIKGKGCRYKTAINVPLKKPPRKYPAYPYVNISLMEINYNMYDYNLYKNLFTDPLIKWGGKNNFKLLNEDFNQNFQADLLKYGIWGFNFSFIGFYPFSIDNKVYTPVSFLFTDPEFKTGGALFRKIDICAVGQCIYAKNVDNTHILSGDNKGDVLSYYTGMELRTRFSRKDFINFFIRYGYKQDYLNCKIYNLKNFWEPVSEKSNGNFMLSAGITLMSFGNNQLLRLWYKPVFNRF